MNQYSLMTGLFLASALGALVLAIARGRPDVEAAGPHVREAVDQPVGTGNGAATQFQLTKRYISGAQSWTRTITKPVAGTVSIALNGTPQASGWSVSTSTGLITFTTAPTAGVAVTAGFEFDVPVRFDTDALDVTLDLERLGSITSIPLVEIRT